MARRRGERGVFQRVLELVLDRRTARETERRAQDAIRKGTDPAAAKKNLGAVGNALHNLRSIAIRVGFALLAVFSVRFAKRMFELGTSVEETASKFRTVFGPAAAEVEEELRGFANTAGLTVQQAQELTGSIGSIVTAMGMGQHEAGQFSTRVLRVSADLASFNNVAGGAETVMEAFQSALTGQFRPLRQYGIMLSVADVNQQALMETGKSHIDQLTQEERSQATLNLAIERAGVQLGDLERTKMSAANTARRLNARFRELQNQLASELLPTFALALGAVDDNDGAFRALGDAIAWTFRQVRRVVAGWAMLGTVIATFAAEVKLMWAELRGRNVAEAMRNLRDTRQAAKEIRAEILAGLESAEELAAAGIAIKDAMEGAAIATGKVNDELQRIEQERIGNLRTALNLEIATVAEKVEVLSLIHQTKAALDAGNLSLEERIRLTQNLKTLTEALGPIEPVMQDVGFSPVGSVTPGDMRALTRPNIPFDSGHQERMAGYVDEMADQWMRANADLVSVAQRAGFGIMNAFRDAFDAVRVEGEGLGGMMEALFRGIGGAALGALADLAASKVAENIAYAAENMAKAMGWIALGNVASASAAKAAAGQHLKAAGMWAVLGGGAAAGQGAVGGSSGGIPSGARDPAGRLADGLDRTGPDIIIRVDGVNPKSPTHQQLIGETSRQYQQRYGGRIRVEGN